MKPTNALLPNLREVSRSLVRELGFFKDECLGTGVTHPQSHALLSLQAKSGQSVSELAQTLQIDQSSGSRLIAGLVKRNLIEQKALPDDKRTKLLSLTQLGRRKVFEINRAADTRVEEALRLLSQEKQHQVVEGFRLYVAVLRRSRLRSEIEVSPIKKTDDSSAAALVRSVMSEFGLNRSGSAFTDPELDYMTRAYNKEGSGFCVARHEGKVVGTAGFGPLKGGTRKTCLVQRMYLAPEYRNLGIGRELLDAIEKKAKRSGYAQAYLETTLQMEGARSFYEARGYKRINRPLGKTGYSLCTHWYVKDLK